MLELLVLTADSPLAICIVRIIPRSKGLALVPDKLWVNIIFSAKPRLTSHHTIKNRQNSIDEVLSIFDSNGTSTSEKNFLLFIDFGAFDLILWQLSVVSSSFAPQ